MLWIVSENNTSLVKFPQIKDLLIHEMDKGNNFLFNLLKDKNLWVIICFLMLYKLPAKITIQENKLLLFKLIEGNNVNPNIISYDFVLEMF